MKTTVNLRSPNAFRGRERRRRRGLLIPTVTLLALSLGAASYGGQVTLSVTPSVSTTAATGSFEVDLTNTSGSDVTVSAFSIQLNLSNLTGVVFTGVSTATTTDPYIFTGVGGEAFLGAAFQFSFSSFPGTGLIASDSDFLSSIPAGGTSPAVTLTSGSTLGLALVTFDASAASAGTALINFLADGTSVTDSNGNALTLDVASPAGSIVVSRAAVPEASTLVIAASGLASVLLAFGLRRAASAVARSIASIRRPEPGLPI
jgi:hypothetical protein